MYRPCETLLHPCTTSQQGFAYVPVHVSIRPHMNNCVDVNEKHNHILMVHLINRMLHSQVDKITVGSTRH